MSRLFERVVRPLATEETPGAFLGGLRVMAVDGTVLDVPDSKANARVFGYPSSRPGTQYAAFARIAVCDPSRSWNTFNCGCIDVSLAYRRASPSLKTTALSYTRDATYVG